MARDFDGSSGYLDLGSRSALDPSFPLTVGAWIRPDTHPANGGYIFAQGRQSTSGFALATLSSTAPHRLQFVKPGAAGISATTVSLTNSVWQFVAAVVTSTNVRFIVITAAGSLSAENVADSTAFATSANDETIVGYLTASGGGATANTRFDGRIAHLGVFIGEALTDAQVKAFAFGGPSAVGHRPDVFLPIWGVASPEADLSGNAFNGTVNGTAPAADGPPVGWYAADAGGMFSTENPTTPTVAIPFISPATTVYAPTLAASGAAALTVPFISAATTLYTVSLAGQIVGVSIAFDDDLLEPNPSWTRIDNQIRVARWEIRRGRQDEREKTETGEATIFVKDTEGWLDPSNVSSPWFGKLDGKQVALARWNPVTQQWYTRFRGTIEEYGHDLSPTQNVDEVAIVCVGFMDYLNSAQMAPGVSGHPGGPAGVVFYDDQDANDRVNDIHADAGFPPELYVTFSLNVVMQETRYDGGYSYLAGIFDAADAEFPGVSNVFEDRFGRVCVHGRHARFDPDSVATDAGNDAWDFNRWKLGDGDAITGDSNYAQLRPPLHADRSLKNVINSALVTPYGIDAGAVAGQVVSDPTSIAAYGVRSYSAQDLRVLEHKTNGDTGAEQCEKVGDFYVTNYKDPRTRPRQATIKSLAPDDARAAKTWLLMSKVDISDVVHLKVTFPGGGGFDEDFYVEGVTESSRPGGPFTPIGDEYAIDEVTLDLSPTAYYNEDTFPDDT